MRLARTIAGVLVVLLVAGGALAMAKKKKGRAAPRGPYPTLGACPVFPASTAAPTAPSAPDQTAWNQNISQAPVDPSSGAIIAAIGGGSLHPDFGSPKQYGFPYSVAAGGKRTKVKFTAYGADSTHGVYRVPTNSNIEGGKKADGDRHVLAINTATCQLQELYRAFLKGKKKKRWNADSAVIWDMRSAALRPDGLTSADAAGLPIFPGLVRFDEAATGTINHAIRVTFDTTRNSFIHPASHCASSNTSATTPPMGLRMRLKSSFDTSGLTGPALAIATALKNYGLIVADNGSDWYFSGSSDRRWNDDNLNTLKSIPGSAFEVVASAAPVTPC